MSETRYGVRHSSLADYFCADSRPGRETAVVWQRGFRMERWTYARLFTVASQFAREIVYRGIERGDRVLIWGGSSGEWLAAFLGCLLRGAVVVPMDAIASPDFARRVAKESQAKLCVIARDLPPIEGIPAIVLEDLPEAVSGQMAEPYDGPPLERDDILEIVFTSGTTAEPRGVVLSHGNLLTGLEPIETEIDKYRKYERFFHPLRFLNLLPLSHVFGQILGIFIPQILGGTTIFLDSLRPGDVAATIRRERVSVLVTVPRLIESLRDNLLRELEAEGRLDDFSRDFAAAEKSSFWRNWWRFRKIHSRFGWKFWALISGGAALRSEEEQFWKRIGYAVIQGYGLTETASLISVNHPFQLGEGSIGKVLPGQEVKIDENGELLVRGENVAEGYWKGGQLTPIGEGGWFRTGDFAERDEAGHLYFRGRQKNVIVTPEGMKVFPEDLEAELRKNPDVRDCVVTGIDLKGDGNAEACAVLLLRETPKDANAAAESIVSVANQSLASYQQIRRWVVWRDQDFPRTPTQKPMLAKIREVAAAELARPDASHGKSSSAAPASQLTELIAQITHHEKGSLPANLDLSTDLNLSSVDRVELMSALEDRYQVDLGEAQFSAAKTVGDIEKILSQPQAQAGAQEFVYPRWARLWPIRAIRILVYYALTWPATMLMNAPRVRGREHVNPARGPFLVVSNHVTYLDVGFVLAALPLAIRNHLATAMDGEKLASMRRPPESDSFFRRALERLKYFLVVALFNVFPLPRRSGFRASFSYAGELIAHGESVLIFPEGELTTDGSIAPFRAGIGLLASQLQIPVIPVRIDGLFELRQTHTRFARPGTVRVTIGESVKFSPEATPEEITHQLQDRVAALGSSRD
ncbi:MAG TPA: AMP-binding protein [Candidatus Acidoferrales bacterium]|nr:AMP-binding protein [Candidatus Acidoferrales bacterium]